MGTFISRAGENDLPSRFELHKRRETIAGTFIHAEASTLRFEVFCLRELIPSIGF